MPVQTTSTSMQPWMQPYAEGFLQRSQQVADTAYQPYQGERVAGFNPLQQQGLDAMANRAMQGSALTGQAQNALGGMIQGQGQQGATANPYMGSNPYLQTQIDAAQGDVVRNWNQVQAPAWGTALNRSGSLDNANMNTMYGQAQSDLQRNLGDISSRMRFQDYGMQAQLGEQFASRNDSMYSGNQNRILQALGMAPDMAQADYQDIDRLLGAGSMYQAQDQRMLDSDFNQFNEARNFDRGQLDIMGNALGRVNGGQVTSTQTPDPSRLAQGIGGALTFAQLWNLLGGD